MGAPNPLKITFLNSNLKWGLGTNFISYNISRKINTHAFLKINHDQYLMANKTGTDTAHSRFSEMS